MGSFCPTLIVFVLYFLQNLENGHLNEENMANVMNSSALFIHFFGFHIIFVLFALVVMEKIHLCRNHKVSHLSRSLGRNLIASLEDP